MGVSNGWGGRWTAVNSLWTYVHRVLHLIGIAAVDKEEVSLLSAPLIRIRLARRRHYVLAYDPNPLLLDEPIGWVRVSDAVSPDNAIFLLHFDSSDPERPDRARIATAAPAQDSPRAWLAVDHKSGVLSLTVSELSAAVFDIRPSPTRGAASAVALHCECNVGSFLSIHPRTQRAGVTASEVGRNEALLIDHIPLPPTLYSITEPPVDYTLALAYRIPRHSHVRIQSYARSWFLVSKPGSRVAAARKNDAGWDAFTLVYDSTTRTALIRDSRGQFLRFTREHDGLMSDSVGSCGDDGHSGPTSSSAVGTIGTSSLWVGPRYAERFVIQLVGKGEEDDAVVLKSRKGFVSARRGGCVVLSQDTTPGQREHFHVRMALPSMTDLSTPRVRLRTVAGGAREVEGSVVAPVSCEIAYEVLSDYNHFSDFMSDSSDSRLLERVSERKARVMMVQCHSFLMLTIPMTMTLDVREEPENGILRMDLVRGLGVKHYQGVWNVIARGDGRCLVRCTIVAVPAVPAPGFLLDGLIAHATSTSMAEIRTECIRRSDIRRSGGAEVGKSGESRRQRNGGQ